MRAAAERGIAFELIYSNALRDPIERRNLLAFGRTLNNNILKRGQSMVFGSNASNSLQIRAPHDMMAICQLFGFDEEIAMKVIKHNPMEVLARSFSRRKTVQGAAWLETTADQVKDTLPKAESFLAMDTISI
jgi:RNase P/RNase MRP subunit p30